MADKSQLVRTLIAEAGIPLTGAVIKDARPGDHYFAIVSISRDGEGRQEPSDRRLEEVRAELLAHGHNVDFVSSEPQTIDIEGGLRAALANVYGDAVVSVAVALQGRRPTVWIEMGDTVMSEAMTAAVQARVALYFTSFNMAESAVQVTSRGNLPSIFACLRQIRLLAPVDIDTLSAKLQAAGFTVPSPEWLSHRLDAMRKAGRLVRLSNGTYSLTADALRKLGTTKRRTSPDVSRMLALARRPR